ncbi:putative 26S proteasome non-ATPase regulatory subunit 2 [Cocos nucifera]|nr:putative 26S proteasome non-ATPase regulatory subunit 2 [Cocos nucifera]
MRVSCRVPPTTIVGCSSLLARALTAVRHRLRRRRRRLQLFLEDKTAAAPFGSPTSYTRSIGPTACRNPSTCRDRPPAHRKHPPNAGIGANLQRVRKGGKLILSLYVMQYDDMPIDALMELVQQIVAFHMKHNAEPEAVDLLIEVEDLDLLIEHVDATNYKRACLYLTSSSSYLPSPDDVLALDIAYSIYMKFEDHASALRIALFIDNIQGLAVELDDDIAADDDDREVLQDIVNNAKLSEGYLTLARDVEVMEPKSPEDIYKVHLIDGRASASSSLDSARQNLAATFVNAFVNAGFGQDKLMTVPSESSSVGSSGSWLFKNKEHGKASAAASLGMILLWDVDSGLAQIDKYLHSNDNHVVAGALLGVGIVNCGVKNDCDPALALLMDFINKEDTVIRIGAILGLGIAYAGSHKDEVRVRLSLIMGDPKMPLEVLVFSAITLGLVYVGSCNEEIAQSIILALMDRSDTELNEPLTRLLPVALGLLYLGKQSFQKMLLRKHYPSIMELKLKYLKMKILSLGDQMTVSEHQLLQLHVELPLRFQLIWNQEMEHELGQRMKRTFQ